MTKELKRELSLLLSCMAEQEMANIALVELDKDCFSDPQTRKIFDNLKEVLNEKRQPTIENVAFPTNYYNEIVATNGFMELKEFHATVSEMINWKNCKSFEGICDLGKSIALKGNFEKAFSFVLEKISNLKVNDTDRSSFKTWQQAGAAAIQKIEHIREFGITDFFIPSGYEDIDSRYGGLMCPALMGVAAPSRGGKSTFIIPTILANLDKEIFCASTEVTPHGLVANICAAYKELPRNSVHRGKLNDDEFNEYIDAIQKQIFSIKGGVTMQRKLSRIVSEMKLWRSKTDITKPAIAIVDFLNDVTDDNGRVYRYEDNIPTAVAILKGLAMELNLCLIVLSQFNRDQKNNKGNRPDQYSIIGSSAFFQSCDILMLPHRPVMWVSEEERRLWENKRYEEAVLIVEKYKEADVYDIPVVFDRHAVVFKCFKKHVSRVGNSEMVMAVPLSVMNDEWDREVERRIAESAIKSKPKVQTYSQGEVPL